MTVQLTIHGEERVVGLSERQQFALEMIERHTDGLDADELGAFLHERRGKHPRDQRCRWCTREGRSAGGELRAKGLVRCVRSSGQYRSLRPAGERAAAPFVERLAP